MDLSIAGILLGLINIAVVVVLLLLIGIIVWWVCNTWITPLPAEVRKLYIALVALIALYMLVAMLFGMPTWHPIARIGG
jgi:hypothetical protein